jgi:hypothetical protein
VRALAGAVRAAFALEPKRRSGRLSRRERRRHPAEQRRRHAAVPATEDQRRPTTRIAKPGLVPLCHKRRTLKVAKFKVKGHRKHGDRLGACRRPKKQRG